MAEPLQARELARSRAWAKGHPERVPIGPEDFPGCEAIHISRDDIEDWDGRVEYWDSHSQLAMIVGAGTTWHHEWPARRLSALVERIAATRGKPIASGGTVDLVRLGEDGRIERLMEADEVLYLDPDQFAVRPARIDVDRVPLPDVVLEVDHSTDARRRKLRLYEFWGFPEIWIDVPEAPWQGRPKSRRSETTIHVLEDGFYRVAEASRAFPGFEATEIHRALNESRTSPETVAALRRVGRTLGAAAGTGPDDDPWLRAERAEVSSAAHADGFSAGHADGFSAGQAEGARSARLDLVRALLDARRISHGPALEGRLAGLGFVSEADIVRAASGCASEDDFFARLVTAEP